MWPFRMAMETIERVLLPLTGHLFPSPRLGRSLFEMSEEYDELDADIDVRPRTSRSTFDADDEDFLVEAHTGQPGIVVLPHSQGTKVSGRLAVGQAV
jgi:hypothetical protein